jgi:cytidine deaminase
MKKTISHTSEVHSYDSVEELSSDLQFLVKKAKSALDSSYSPYSGFKVAAALRLSNGEIVLGSNQENIAYPSGLCAERVAIFSAGTNFPGVEMEAIAIVAKSQHGEVTDPVTPCGACRQVMIELESTQSQPMTVVMTGENGEAWVSESVGNLIPFYFSSSLVGRADQ